MTQATPTDPQELRDEIERTRSDLGKTIETLAAKTDVKARAKDAVGRATSDAKQKIGEVREQVRRATSGAGSRIRKPLPVAAIVAAAVVVTSVVIFFVRRRRS